MKIKIRLGSVVQNGVGGPESEAISLMYSFLLEEFKQSYYSAIFINQIGDDLEEFICKEGKKTIRVNLRYPTTGFDKMATEERNLVRLKMVDTALRKIIEFEGKIDIVVLDSIKDRIVKERFVFEIPYAVTYNREKGIVAKVVVEPFPNTFLIYVEVLKMPNVLCKLLVFRGIPGEFYLEKFFSKARWLNENGLIVFGSEPIVEIHVRYDTCKFEEVNLTKYPFPPFYGLMKTDLSTEDRKLAESYLLGSLSS